VLLSPLRLPERAALVADVAAVDPLLGGPTADLLLDGPAADPLLDVATVDLPLAGAHQKSHPPAASRAMSQAAPQETSLQMPLHAEPPCAQPECDRRIHAPLPAQNSAAIEPLAPEQTSAHRKAPLSGPESLAIQTSSTPHEYDTTGPRIEGHAQPAAAMTITGAAITGAAITPVAITDTAITDTGDTATSPISPSLTTGTTIRTTIITITLITGIAIRRTTTMTTEPIQ